MTDKEVQEAVARADAEYDMLKDRVHEQYDEIQKLKEDVDYYKSSRDELISSNAKLREEKLRLNNIINNPEDLTLCKMWADTKLKEKNEELMSLYTSERYVKEDYKSKVNKAIEYLESYNTDFKNCRFGEAPISLRELGDLLDILKGDDKE